MITFFDHILNYVGLHKADYVISDEFYANVKGPRNRKIEAKVYSITSAVSTSENQMGPRFFVVLDDSYEWAEITGTEYKALDILRDVDDALEILGGDEHSVKIEYDTETCKIKITGKSFKITRDNVNDIDEFLKVVDAMGYIRSGEFYERIKEAKHE